MNNTCPLRIALLANAGFSATCGMLMLVRTVFAGILLGVHAPLLLRLLGVGLLLFSIDLVHQTTRPRLATWRALYASVGDFLWVITSLLGLLLFSNLFSLTGVALVLIIAGVVLAFGCWQKEPAVQTRLQDIQQTVKGLEQWKTAAIEMGQSPSYVNQIQGVINSYLDSKPLSEAGKQLLQQANADLQAYQQMQVAQVAVQQLDLGGFER